ncbi:hypothetical protein KP509_11G041600 [Ceratopteris richardii]|uniref:Uncharacterized protein n=1 Tax=Ceratopteris richardii TaxID=49495 RepID=A0A8T2TTW4_CERRI|nr:hypothetical protein KP509_11G041600 [Ceratopteris richardii]
MHKSFSVFNLVLLTVFFFHTYDVEYAIRVSKENHLNYLVMSTKEKFLEFDHDSLKMKVEVVQGGYLGIMVKSYTYSIHIIEGALPDTCIAHWCFEYKALSPKHHLMLCARLNEVLPVSLKGIESYLLSNDEYQERA